MDRQQEILKTYIALMRVHGEFEKLVKKDANRYGLNVTEFAVLELLYNRGQQPIQQIGSRILIASSSTTYVVDKLCNKGYAKRIPDANDRRVTFTAITDKGKELMDQVYPEHRDHLVEFFEEVSDGEIVAMKKVLQRMSHYE